MKIIIPYESKWSVSLTDHDTGLTKFSSVGGLAEKKDKDYKSFVDANDDYEQMMKRVNENFKNFDYTAITKNTVVGIIARLLGEIRYMKDALKDDDHIIHKIQDKVTFRVKERDLYNEIMSLNTPMKDSPSNGQGVIFKNKNGILLSKNIYSEIIYSMLNIQNLDQLEDFVFKLKRCESIEAVKGFLKDSNLLEQNIQLHKFMKGIETFEKRFEFLENGYKKAIKEDESTEENQRYIEVLKDIGIINCNDENCLLGKNRFLAGILVYTIASWLEKIGEKDTLNEFLYTKQASKADENKPRCIPGITSLSAGSPGQISAKGIYDFFAYKKRTNTSPYIFSMEFFKKEGEKNPINTKMKLGIGKEDGILEIDINVTKEEAIALKEQIENVGVSTFQMGKKGLAYVRRIEL